MEEFKSVSYARALKSIVSMLENEKHFISIPPSIGAYLEESDSVAYYYTSELQVFKECGIDDLIGLPVILVCDSEIRELYTLEKVDLGNDRVKLTLGNKKMLEHSVKYPLLNYLFLNSELFHFPYSKTLINSLVKSTDSLVDTKKQLFIHECICAGLNTVYFIKMAFLHICRISISEDEILEIIQTLGGLLVCSGGRLGTDLWENRELGDIDKKYVLLKDICTKMVEEEPSEGKEEVL